MPLAKFELEPIKLAPDKVYFTTGQNVYESRGRPLNKEAHEMISRRGGERPRMLTTISTQLLHESPEQAVELIRSDLQKRLDSLIAQEYQLVTP